MVDGAPFATTVDVNTQGASEVDSKNEQIFRIGKFSFRLESIRNGSAY
jgi:hypothetical protein